MWPWKNEDGLINNQDKIIQKPGRKKWVLSQNYSD